MGRKKIAVKYCGGCNPTYDRVETIRKITSEYKNRFQFIPYDGIHQMDAILFVSGCPRACATKDFPFLKIPDYSVSRESDLEDLIKDLLSRLK